MKNKNKVTFLEVCKYYFGTRSIKGKGSRKRRYFNRGICILHAFLFWLIIPLFIISSPYLYFKFKRILEKKRGIRK